MSEKCHEVYQKHLPVHKCLIDLRFQEERVVADSQVVLQAKRVQYHSIGNAEGET